MNQITQPPTGVSDAGQGFNYDVWTAGTTLMLANVPWSSDYRDIVDFPNQNAVNNYLTLGAGNPVVQITHASYARFGQPIRVSIPFNVAQQYNYLRVHNPAQPVTGDDVSKSFYYFILGVNYVSPNTTEILVQLDVWTTFGLGVEFGRCYVERGHLGIANMLSEVSNGQTYLTVPEGLDLGNEYRVRRQDRYVLQKTSEGSTPRPFTASMIVVSTVNFQASGVNASGDPVLVTASGQWSINGVPSGADVYYFETPEDFTYFLSRKADQPWVTQGVIAAYLVPPIRWSEASGAVITDGANLRYRKLSSYNGDSTFTISPNWRSRLQNTLPARYRHLTKFLTYPYAFVELTMYNGTPIVLKPELISNQTGDLELRMLSMLTPPNPRSMLLPKDYNSTGSASEYLDLATGIFNMPQMSIVNNAYLNYLASNQNSIAFGHQSAEWSQNRIMASAETAFRQGGMQAMANRASSNRAIQAASEQMRLSNATTAMRGATQAANQVIGRAGRPGQLAPGQGKNFAGAAAADVGITAANAGIDIFQNTMSTDISNRANRDQTTIGNELIMSIRDSNLSLAEFVSDGDYQNAIAGINAKVQDAKMLQPTTAGQVGGDAFAYSVNNGYIIDAKFKTVNNSAIAMIGEFWLRYGYAINRFHEMKQLNVMEKFTYWKVKELYLKPTRIPEVFRNAIRGIFEKGVTVWASPSDIATLDIGDNAPKEGIQI